MSITSPLRRGRTKVISRQSKPTNNGKAIAPYQNPKASVERRVKDLLSRMTVQEKADQMMCVWQQKAATLVDENGAFDFKKAKTAFKRGRAVGQVGRPSDAAGGLNARRTAELTNSIQRFFLEQSRLGIPVV